ncbi:MAG: serine hydrolase domain-containing protein, partial [Gemmatimonadaceae bacterium]
MTHRYLRQLSQLLLFVFPGGAAIAQPGHFDLEKTKRVLTGLIEKTLAENGIPSMSIALVRGDSIVWKAAFGYSNLATRTRATTETIYSTGSSFKSVTATAIMQLAEQGKLKLDDPITRYLGDSLKDRLQGPKPVTFTNLLSH